MEQVISHKSALEFWRDENAKDINAGKKIQAVKPPVVPIDVVKTQNEVFSNISTPIHFLVGSSNARRVSKNFHYHISSREFPKGSFILLSTGLLVSSPELCFLQIADEISFIELVRLGYELCGSYRIDKKRGFCSDMPRLTTVSKLKAYLSKSTGQYGVKNAVRALPYIIDGSASPMETILTMLLILPYKYGGFGFPKPQLNYGIEVPDKVTGKNTKRKFYCDLYWPEKKVAVEYDSDERHTGALRIERDSIRRNALMSSDIAMVSVTRRQLYDSAKMRDLSEVLSRLLKKRLMYQAKEFMSKNKELLDQLLPDDPLDR